MKLLLAGHSVLDHISAPDGFRFQPGGVFYSALGLKSLIAPDDEFYLCTLIEKEHYNLFAGAFDSFDRRFSAETGRIPRVHLTIFDEKERCERFENLNSKVVLPAETDIAFDGILVNMISGFEIESVDLAVLKKQFSCPVYFDVHSLSRGIGGGLVRDFRRIPDFEDWCKSIDILQCNENELLTLTDKQEEVEIISLLMEWGPEIILVTKGEKGASAYYKSGAGNNMLHISARTTEVRNKVGCGDIFGSYFFYNYIKSHDIASALQIAVTAGECVTRYQSINEFESLRNDVTRITS